MREIQVRDVIDAVAAMCIKANTELPDDVRAKLEQAMAAETSASAKEVLRQLLENADLARDTKLPLCQDCGLAVLFVEVGDGVRVVGGNLREAINAGVRKGYADGFLRKSACHPLTRANTGDGTPAIIHFDMVPGDTLKLVYMAKGGGSENMSRVTMLSPAQGWEGVRKFVINRVAEAGPNPCPPTVIGIGIGGTFDHAARIAKKSLMRRLDDTHPDPDIAAREQELEDALNDLGIGPMGLGGKTTVLGVKIAMEPCHLASLPLAVNVQCHSQRHEEVVL
ncbi:MAG: fumarate hydratase [Pseudodesulfovibrio sp.]|uniref:Hydro-lyase, Fe-S type, tartrate/fumarate subfamily, alpha subunit n=1 Tax=Pseudodesulfovibrio aespoeensis (strain ATCC 700646 / DSM 10631 / Aspo-2) TaxID=643562 RepID=E6VRN4_PSEA9|nr:MULTISPECIES: fumarate hydratase [Pseudodesulfovibrio]MBU4378390.1 fumarate hydratase [Pseudomonadota bacterium]ADU63071.1 hydro-lyase, Fe-S type, tartrate/fumarate subfamily, alpha subunit [Pseudodesulfovibrio aespoeensis Aspo-2]MBU4474153.1 fumarate hydratase [Pseudomonadota bacterium]MBU4517706.1 fumarate hydratase [Pseudomonadota bacterium]MBU4523097.1 fumarate hydratase [Pseudomonadota bacterium]